MNQPKYPLEQLISVKKNRLDQAIKVLEEKKTILAREQQKLLDAEKERDAVLQHRLDKLAQLREGLDTGIPSEKIQQMKSYLKVVDERMKEKQKKVDAQKFQVDAAQKQVDLATAEMFRRKKDVEKIDIHKTEWEKEARYWVEHKETIEHDEQGSAAYMLRKKERESP